MEAPEGAVRDEDHDPGPSQEETPQTLGKDWARGLRKGTEADRQHENRYKAFGRIAPDDPCLTSLSGHRLSRWHWVYRESS